MSPSNSADDIDVRSLTPADFDAADAAIRQIAIELPDLVSARLRLAARHQKIGADRFSFLYFLREPKNCCEKLERSCILGLTPRQTFEEHLREHIEHDLTAAKLDQFARDLDRRLDSYCRLWQILTFTPLKELTEDAISTLTAQLDQAVAQSSEKSTLYAVELMYISRFLAEVRIEKGWNAATLVGYDGTCAADLGWMFPRLLEEAWEKSLREAARQCRSPVIPAAIEVFRGAYQHQLPSPNELYVLVHQEFALARVVLRERKQSDAEGAGVAHTTPQLVVAAQEAIIQTGALTTSKAGRQQRPPPLLTVAAWSDLGIALDSFREVWAIAPAPAVGSEVRKSDLVRLPLSGRWLDFLDLLAASTDGRAVSRYDVMRTFGILPTAPQVRQDGRARRNQVQSAVREELPLIGNAMNSEMNKALAELSRKLRKHVAGPTGKMGKAIFVDGSNVRLGFLVRPLFRDDSGHFSFGRSRGADYGTP